MFALRGLDVSVSVFVIVYCALSLAVCVTWRRIHAWLQHHPQHRAADLLFGLRMFPLVTATVITAAFTVPSFLLLEPRAIHERVGDIPLLLGVCGAAFAIFGLINAASAMIRASRTISLWARGAEPIEPQSSPPVLRISRPIPAMTAVGIIRPKVLLSGAAERALTGNELQTALNHEVAHIRRRDNLRKLLLRFVAFPGMRGLEAAWLEATEMAADDSAVSDAAEALDLAAALIKLSRLGPAETPADLTAALVHNSVSVINARVERLIHWSDERQIPPQRLSLRYGLAVALVTLTMFGIIYSQLLSDVHTATEWLMR